MTNHYNLARMTTATTGTGTITLGSAATGFLTFAAAGAVDGDLVSYAIEDGNNREVGIGTYAASAQTLTRATILNSTNSGAAISLSGAAQVFSAILAQDLLSAVYDIGFEVEGLTYSSEVVGRFAFPRSAAIAAGASGVAKAGTAATGSAVYALARNGTGIGTITFAASGTTGTVSITATTNFVSGDVLTVTGPATPDATLANVGITLAFTH